MTDAGEVAEAVDAAARRSYGRLVAALAAPTRDLALAEDALAFAFERALELWPRAGVPASPEGWLMTVGRHRITDVLRSAARRTSVALDEARDVPAPPAEPDPFPDRLLALLFVCAHPAIEPGIRTPLMLQSVLGVEARAIAAAFAVPAPAMAQRLVRAKRRIRDAGIAFEVPDRSRWNERLPPVLEAVYGAYAIARSGSAEADLRDEALHLGRLLADLLPDEPEVLGLAALLHLTAARDDPGRAAFVPLDEQDPATWDRALLGAGRGVPPPRRRARPPRAVPARGGDPVRARRPRDHRRGGPRGDPPAVGRARRASHRPSVPASRMPSPSPASTARPPGSPCSTTWPATETFQPAWAARAALLAAAGHATRRRSAPGCGRSS